MSVRPSGLTVALNALVYAKTNLADFTPLN
jgi:hypothetical protein